MNTQFKRAVGDQWYLVDGSNQRLGRLAAQIAFLLMGKHRPDWSPHWSSNDHVVVINAEKIVVSGNKLHDKIYYRHSGYPGGLKRRSLSEMQYRKPQFALEHAVRGMLPKNRLGRELYTNLMVYSGAAHPHVGQNPALLKGNLNNVRELYAALRLVTPTQSAKPKVGRTTSRSSPSVKPTSTTSSKSRSQKGVKSKNSPPVSRSKSNVSSKNKRTVAKR